ncbi:MAG: hypothetical protein U5L06_03860 [Rhodovibrio sp.]|nr:hypothetical protein [Rhodovibrio sp.]
MRFPFPGRAGAIAGAAAALLLTFSPPADAEVNRAELEKRVAEQFDARVLKVEEGTLNGQDVLFVTMMRERANSNAAFKVDTLAFDPETGEALLGKLPSPREGQRRDTSMMEKRPDVLRGRPWR